MDTSKYISSPVSVGGPLPRVLQEFETTPASGQGRVPVSHSATLESILDQKIIDTSGPRCSGSSLSAALQSSLESKLRARLDVNGSPEYALTWKNCDIGSGAPICALLASASRTLGRGFTGWQSPRARGDAGGTRWKFGIAKNLEDQCRIFAIRSGLKEEEVRSLSVSPMFYRNLMGFPAEWDYSTVSATPSSHPSPLNS